MILFLELVKAIIHKYFLEECKYILKKKEDVPKHITDDVKISSDEENSGKEKSDEENYSEE